MSYYINQIKNNVYNQYKYHYLDHMTCVIDIRDNYWSFAMDLFSINDFRLPINSLAADLSIPYQQVKDIAFNLASDQSGAKVGVTYNKDYSHIYSGHFDVDISQNEYLKQDINNVKLNLALSLFIDPEAAKGAGTELSQDVLDPLINETSEQRWDFTMYYSNTHLIQQNAIIKNVTSYSLPFGNECIPISNDIDCRCDNLLDLSKPFNNLVSIMSNEPFQVLAGKVKINYWLELEAEAKTLEKTLNISKLLNNSIVIALDDYTIFDFEKNEIKFDPAGAKGIYIPKYSHGYYELELQILQNSAISKFVIKNDFSFIVNEGKPTIGITHVVINNIDDFKEVTF